MSLKAIIIGGTGATGRQLLSQLLDNDRFTKITSVGRRPALNGKENDKLTNVIVDTMEDLSSTEQHWQDNDVFFNCIGTTRQKAGGAKGFVAIELGFSREAARMASLAKISHAALISAGGANHKAWAVEWLHPLLYTKTMGQKEETVVTEYDFKTVSIFKPGMLIRLMDEKEWYDGITEKLGIGLRVDILAKSMMRDAEEAELRKEGMKVQAYTGNSVITKLANI